VKYLLLGRAQVPYWYIPFRALVFLISPLLARISRRTLGWIVLLSSMVPLLGSRTTIEKGYQVTSGGSPLPRIVALDDLPVGGAATSHARRERALEQQRT